MNTPRLFFHSDANFFYCARPPITAERFVHDAVEWMNGTQVDGIICHMYTFGDCTPMFTHDYEPGKAVFPDKSMSVLTWKGKRNLLTLLESDQDYWALAIEAAHAQGKPFWGAMRFNDSHPGEYGVRSNFCIEHPEYRLDKRCGYPIHGPSHDGSTPPCVHLDFSIPEVRAHQLKLVELLCRRYDIDGFEWDFTRDAWHNFPADKKDQGADITTGHMKDARDLLDRIGRERGRPIEFGARVPATLESCREADIDAARWIQEDIVDLITPTVYYDTTCEIPFDRFVDLARSSRCRVYANVTEGVGPGRFRPPPIEAVRAGALNAWRQGIDGINMFNYHHHQVADGTADVALLSELGSPDTLEVKDKLYMLAGIGVAGQSRFYAMAYDTAHPHQLPRDFKGLDDTIDLHVNVSDDLGTARYHHMLAAITLTLDLCHITGEEQLDLRINDVDVPVRHGRFAPSAQYPWNWNSHMGHFEIQFDLAGLDCIQQGDNRFSLTLRDRPEDIEPLLKLYTLQLAIKYRALPMGIN